MGELSDESYSVRDQDREILPELDTPNQCIQRRKQPFGHQSVLFGKCPKEGRLAGIGVADEGHERQLVLATPLSMQLPVLPDLFDVPFQGADAVANLPPIHFQFGFTRTARADAATETGEIIPIA